MVFIHAIVSKVSSWFKGLNPVFAWFISGVIEGFAAAISYCNIDSYGADKHHTNGLFWFLGIVFTLGTVYSIYRAATQEK